VWFVKNQSPSNTDFTFRKEEKLCSEKIIAGLFQPGFFVSVFPFRINVIYTKLPVDNIQAQVMFIVGKKRFKRAVDRNRIKRIMRELYRLEKHTIYESLSAKGQNAALALIFTGAELPDYKLVEPKFKQLVNKLNHAISNK
jgi:ribonuclease P protein component